MTGSYFRPRALTAQEAVQTAEYERRRRAAERPQWPQDYQHDVPPPGSIPLHEFNTTLVAVPAKGVTAVVFSYTVPDGMRAFLKAILQNYNGGTVFTVGDLLWTVTENQPTGISDVQGAGVHGLVSLPVPLGSWTQGTRWKFETAYEFAPNTVLRSVCLNSTGNVPAGAPNYLTSAFFGYLVPDLEVRR